MTSARNSSFHRAAARRRALYTTLLGAAVPLVVEPVLGARYLSISRWLQDFSALPDQDRRAWQQERLAEVLRHARDSVPFYRRVLMNADPARTALADLPVVDKALVRCDQDAFRSDGWSSMRYVVKTTGGTTGDPWRYELDRAAWAHVYAAGLHFWGETGYRYGERIALLGTPPSLVAGGLGWKSRIRRALERRVHPSTGVATDHESSLRHARSAARSRAVLWYGYAGMIAAMADSVLAEGIELRGRPRGIVTTSEPLLPEWRRRIERAFGVPVFDQYGCNDGGVLAQTCAHGRFHLADSVSIVELLDGDAPCPPGTVGDVVVTNLHARVLPFLRYRVGDRAVLAEGPCQCGRPGPTLARVIGRSGDSVKLPDGGEVSLPGLTTAFWEAPNVRRWQLVQTDLDRIRVRLELAPGFDRVEAARLEEALRRRCGGSVAVELVTNEPFERTPGGKLQVVVSRV